MLKIKNVTKKYSENIILNNINLEIDEKQIVGLAGPSGGGKSTLLRCIQKLETLNFGEIEFQGKTGFMFQDFQLFPHMNVYENLIYACKVSKLVSNYKKKAFSLLEELGLSDKINNFPSQLSGGQKQRVALARSLMMEPDILLCDEPTSGLDVATIADVVALLAKVKSMGVSMIIASHDLDFLAQISDRIILLKDGAITADILTAKEDNIINILKRWYY